MASKPKRPCKHMGCTTLVTGGYCDEHRPKEKDYRESAHKRGYTYKWSKEAKKYLAENPWCCNCRIQRENEPATEVDHIIPHKGNRKLFWDKSNWQGLCASCHSTKTAKEDGGFGRPTPHSTKLHE